jgi:hypothetical protein
LSGARATAVESTREATKEALAVKVKSVMPAARADNYAAEVVVYEANAAKGF